MKNLSSWVSLFSHPNLKFISGSRPLSRLFLGCGACCKKYFKQTEGTLAFFISYCSHFMLPKAPPSEGALVSCLITALQEREAYHIPNKFSGLCWQQFYEGLMWHMCTLSIPPAGSTVGKEPMQVSTCPQSDAQGRRQDVEDGLGSHAPHLYHADVGWRAREFDISRAGSAGNNKGRFRCSCLRGVSWFCVARAWPPSISVGER